MASLIFIIFHIKPRHGHIIIELFTTHVVRTPSSKYGVLVTWIYLTKLSQSSSMSTVAEVVQPQQVSRARKCDSAKYNRFGYLKLLENTIDHGGTRN